MFQTRIATSSSFSQVSEIIIKTVMMLNYFFHENSSENKALMLFDSSVPIGKKADSKSNFNDFRLVSEKISIPDSVHNFTRARLNQLLSKQIEQFGNSLILGRAGTGKTSLAIEFTAKYERVAWFRIESTDSDWNAFSQYFISSFRGLLIASDFIQPTISADQPIDTKVLKFLELLSCKLEKIAQEKQILIVLDDIHNVFDAEWLEIFFKGLIDFQNPNVRILFISRIKPIFPLWRLRSKQKLGVLEENLLLFNMDEIEELFLSKGISNDEIKQIYKTSYGRISKIIELQDIRNFS